MAQSISVLIMLTIYFLVFITSKAGNGNGNGNGNSNGNGNGNGCNGQGNPNCNDDTTTTTTTSTTTTTTTLPTTTTTSATSIDTTIETGEPELTFFETFDSTSDDDCPSECYEDVNIPTFCEYASYQWDDPSIPLEERNNIGRAKYLSEETTLKALSIPTIGKTYKIVYPSTNFMPEFPGRAWASALIYPNSAGGNISEYYKFARNEEECGTGFGGLEQRLLTTSIGNSGTQFDGLGHFFWVNGENGDARNYIFHNGFRGSDVMKDYGLDYIGIEQLPPIITRAILLDVAGYEGVDVLDPTYKIDTDAVTNTLIYQGMSLDDIEEGDVILIHTGYAAANWFGDPSIYYRPVAGLTLDTVINIFGPKKVVMLGSDNWGVEFVENFNFPLHVHWLICNGGFLYENLKLDEWVADIRNGNAPYIGGFWFTPAQITGGVGGLGAPMVIV